MCRTSDGNYESYYEEGSLEYGENNLMAKFDEMGLEIIQENNKVLFPQICLC